MADRRRQALRISLVVFGTACLLVYPLILLWPSGWAWQPRQPEYEQMLAGIYATLGVFLLWASRRPELHLSLIWFAVWSSVVHGGIMAVQAIVDPVEHGHLPGDVAALFLMAAALAALAPRGVVGGRHRPAA
jgi:peptidoglycan/LPS O-acetylase OafA/YrhL